MSRESSKKNDASDRRGTRGKDADVDRLDELSRLLEAVHQLMQDEGRLGADAFEHLRRLRVKIRFAKSAIAADPAAPLPTAAPRLWQHRHSDERDPLAFTAAVYAPWLHRGLARSHIRHLDLKLYNAWYSHKITDAQLDEIGLPTKADLTTKALEAAGPLRAPSRALDALNLSPAETERARLWNVARRRKQLKDQ